AAHDLAAAGLGQHVDAVQVADHGDGAKLAADGGEELLAELGGEVVALLQDDEGGDDLAAQLVGPAGDAGLGDGGVLHERALDLDGADAVRGDLDDLVGPPAEPHVAVLVDGGGVAGEVDGAAGDALPVVAA